MKDLQEVVYEDKKALEETFKKLKSLPPLIFAGEARQLQNELALAACGKAFVLQGGDCAESFEGFSTDKIRDDFKLILQMALILSFESAKPVVKIGRFAGQFAKPRSNLYETRGDVTLPSFRGDIINALSFDEKSRLSDPKRMLQAYYQSTSSLNLIRAFIQGGLSDLDKIEDLRLDSKNEKFLSLCEDIKKALGFFKACRLDTSFKTKLYTSHEALLLPYERALARVDSLSGELYGCSAHQLWLGDRTKELNGPHASFLKDIQNPLGVKVGPSTKPEDLLKLCEYLNPKNTPGRLSLIFRLGSKEIEKTLPKLLDPLKTSGFSVLYLCDPMHGNTKKEGNLKTRFFKDILSETHSFFALCKDLGINPAGIHLELCAQNVTECVGGVVSKDELHKCYKSLCDPRLNASQALEYAFHIASII